MSSPKKKYHLPAGYSLLQTALKSNEFLENPVKFIAKSMDKFSGTYTASLGRKKKIILTQNPDFINYILKENHRNYNKSEFATERAVLFLGKGLLLSNDDYWLRQRRLIQPCLSPRKDPGALRNCYRLYQRFSGKISHRRRRRYLSAGVRAGVQYHHQITLQYRYPNGNIVRAEPDFYRDPELPVQGYQPAFPAVILSRYRHRSAVPEKGKTAARNC